jgi:SAM-dependent methyltransferase
LETGSLVVGLDFSSGMLGRRQSAIRRSGLSSIRWVQADAAALPFKAGVFDTVTCAYALYELKGAARGEMLHEVARVLCPDGRFLAMEHEVPTRPLPRLLFSLRLAIIGAEGARAFLGGEVQELGRVFGQARKERLPPGSKILIGIKHAETSNQDGADNKKVGAWGDK